MGIFRKIVSSWIFLYSLFAIIVLGAASYLILGQGIETTITRQILDRERTITRAEAVNITTFFEKTGNGVATLANLSSIEDRGVDTIHDLDVFVEQRRQAGIINGVVLTDKNGVVQFNSNVSGTRNLGASLSDRDYFVWAKTKVAKGDFFLSQPVKSIVVVASPVIINGKFSGVVAASVKLQPLTDQFFGLMKISDLTKVYLVDGGGDLLYSNLAPDKIGSNISEIFSDDSVLSNKIKNALGATAGDQFQTGQHLVAYSPVILGTQSWLLIVSSHPQEVVNLSRPLYIRQTAIFALSATTILLFGVITTAKKNQS